MTQKINIRPGKEYDLARLVEIENTCFNSDNLSRRSFQRFIRKGAHELLVAEIKQDKGTEIVGYGLTLYRTGTSLARLYSLAVMPEHQGKGIARQLMQEAEKTSLKQHCAYMRLEVNVNNASAIHLYGKLGYLPMGKISQYYDDGSDALRMEKKVYSSAKEKKTAVPYYEQTTDFTCGPASLMMAMKSILPKYQMSRREELQIWREATTIFMTSGHGGCSPHGLALSAWQRKFLVELYINQAGTPFIDSVRDPDKKAVMELVHEDFMAHIKETNIALHIEDISPDKLQQLLRSGFAMIALISTFRFNRNKSPHWVFVTSADEYFVYINDPDISDGPYLSETDYIQVPISIEEFINIACFGQSRLRSLIVLKDPVSTRPV